MLLSAAALLFAASGASATLVLADLAASPDLLKRDVAQGWSLQSSSSNSNLHSCGNGAFCPISLQCNSMVNNHQVAACCSSSSDCRGDVENAPVCADSSWSLWVGYDGNGFCCQVGQVGAYDITKSVAGVCVAAGDVGSLRNAVLTSSGTGSAATTVPGAGSSAATTTASTSTSSASKSSATSSAAEASSTHTSTTAVAVASTTVTSSSSSASDKSASSTSAESSSSAGTASPTSTSANGTSSADSSKATGAANTLSMGAGAIVAALVAVVAL